MQGGQKCREIYNEQEWKWGDATVNRTEFLSLFEGTFKFKYMKYEGWNFNSGNYLFTTDTK